MQAMPPRDAPVGTGLARPIKSIQPDGGPVRGHGQIVSRLVLAQMNCPHCHRDIPDAEIARHLASKGGSATGQSKARDSSKMREAQKKSVIARKLNAQKPRKPK